MAFPILHLATGTANMLARDLGLPRNPEALAEILDYGAVRNVDMGLVGARRFLLLASAGFDATVAEEVQKSRGATLGYHGYAMPVLRGLVRWCPTELAIRVCEEAGGEVIGADSVQIYRHFDIGSGKPTRQEQSRARHHLIDVADAVDP